MFDISFLEYYPPFQLASSQRKNPVRSTYIAGNPRIIHLQLHIAIFKGCLSDDDRVTLVPYYGNHHSTHDSLALFVPMLANPRSGLSRIGAAYTRHEFLNFQERFLTQVQVYIETIDTRSAGIAFLNKNGC